MLLRKKIIAMLIGVSSLTTTNAFSQNNSLFIDNNGNENQQLNDIGSEKPLEINDNYDDAYVKPKKITKGVVVTKGYALSNTKNIPKPYINKDYINQINNEVEKLKSIPDDGLTPPDNLTTLRYGDSGDNVKALVHALSVNGFIDEDSLVDKELYNDEVETAVKEAQKSFGIKQDGIAGKMVYNNLFTSKKDQLPKLESWLNQINDMINVGKSEGNKYIVIVNIPSYTLHVIDTETQEEILQSKVVVGKPSSQTPIGRSNILGLKYNPTWTPPMSDIKKRVLPNLTVPYGMYVIDQRGNKVPNSNITANGLLTGQYSVQQPAGPNSALGLLKFETDSKISIYLHDTNHRPFFNREQRALSMGCVRVQQWPSLAAILANSDQNYIFNNIDKGKTYIQRVDHTPVFYTYSLVDNVNGQILNYSDIYHRG